MRLLAECISQKGNISCRFQRQLVIVLCRIHELSMSRHIPEREHLGQGGQETPLGTEPEIAGERRGDVDLLAPTMGAVGEIGRTPVPVVESTRHPGERPLTPVTKHKKEKPDQKGESPIPAQGQRGTTGEVRGDCQGGEPEWTLPRPSDPCRPPRERDRERRGNPSGHSEAG